MKIGIVGLGYVGLSTGLGLSVLEHEILGFEINEVKSNQIKNCNLPIYEEGMQELLNSNLNKSFFVVDSLEHVVLGVEAVYICVPTPTLSDGSINLSFVMKVAKDIGSILKQTPICPLIIVKSTVTPGSTKKVAEIIAKESNLPLNEVNIAMLPEFLKQGTAYNDFINPDRIIFGIKNGDLKSKNILFEMYKSINVKKFVVDIETAEFSKYASNSFLALKITFANELANLIDKFNLEKEGRVVNIDRIVEIMGSDKRINPAFLGAGPGFGGSCFPKDVKSLAYFSREYNTPFRLLETISEANQNQAKMIINYAKELIGNLKGKNIGIVGLAFKPNTDDTRESPSKKIIDYLLNEGSNIFTWDPKAENNMRLEYPTLVYNDSLEDFENNKLDLAIIVTDWAEVKSYFGSLTHIPYKIIDTRRIGINADIIIGNSKKLN